MRKIPVVSSDEKLNDIIKPECAHVQGRVHSRLHVDKPDEVIEFLKYELPEIKIFYFSDQEGGRLGHPRGDHATIPGSTTAASSPSTTTSDEKELLESIRDAEHHRGAPASGTSRRPSPRLLRILRQNKQILFQRGIQQHLLKNISGSFVMDNDPLDITTYTNLITNYLYNANLIEQGDEGQAPRGPPRAPHQRDRARQLQDQLSTRRPPGSRRTATSWT